MEFKTAYLQGILEDLKAKSGHEKEFIQAATECPLQHRQNVHYTLLRGLDSWNYRTFNLFVERVSRRRAGFSSAQHLLIFSRYSVNKTQCNLRVFRPAATFCTQPVTCALFFLTVRS